MTRDVLCLFFLLNESSVTIFLSYSLHRSQEKHNWIQMNRNLCKSINPHIDLSRLFIIKIHMIFYTDTQTKGQHPHNIHKVIFISEKCSSQKRDNVIFHSSHEISGKNSMPKPSNFHHSLFFCFVFSIKYWIFIIFPFCSQKLVIYAFHLIYLES